MPSLYQGLFRPWEETASRRRVKVFTMPPFEASLGNYVSLCTHVEELQRWAFREQARTFQFCRVNTLLCPLAERQITSKAVSRESVRKAHPLYTHRRGKKRSFCHQSATLAEMGIYERERHSQFQRRDEKYEKWEEWLAQQGVNTRLTSGTYAHTDRIAVLHRYMHTDTLMVDT